MRHSLLRTGFIMFITSAVALSCREEQTTEVAKAQSPFRSMIEAYFDQLKPETEKEIQHLSDLRNAIDFYDIDRQKLTDNEDMLIVGTHDFDFERKSEVKALFFIQNGEVVRSNLVSFSDRRADHNKLIMLINRRRFDPKSYNGRIAYYNIFGDIIFFNEIEDGQFIANGIAQSRSSSKAHSVGRSQGCIDWFLITTYHYAGGGTSTTETYLTTTCDNECQTFRMEGRTQCGGGGGGSWMTGPSMPTYAQGGDRYIFTDQDGKTTTYLYDALTHAWTIYLVVLPETVVQSHPMAYSYLVSDGPPADNTVARGPDNLTFIYDAWSGAWEGGEEFEFGGGGRDPARIITNRPAHFRCFNRSSPANLTIYIDQPRAGSSTPIASGDVGHAWLGITQTVGNQTVTRIFGFYPLGRTSPVTPSDPSVLYMDGGHEYDVSVTVPITAAELGQIADYVTQRMPDTYNLNTANCVDFVVETIRAAGIRLPETERDWVAGGGLCPGQFGEDMRTFDVQGRGEQRDLDGGVAPQDSGNCQ